MWSEESRELLPRVQTSRPRLSCFTKPKDTVDATAVIQGGGVTRLCHQMGRTLFRVQQQGSPGRVTVTEKAAIPHSYDDRRTTTRGFSTTREPWGDVGARRKATTNRRLFTFVQDQMALYAQPRSPRQDGMRCRALRSFLARPGTMCTRASPDGGRVAPR